MSKEFHKDQIEEMLGKSVSKSDVDAMSDLYQNIMVNARDYFRATTSVPVIPKHERIRWAIEEMTKTHMEMYGSTESEARAHTARMYERLNNMGLLK